MRCIEKVSWIVKGTKRVDFKLARSKRYDKNGSFLRMFGVILSRAPQYFQRML